MGGGAAVVVVVAGCVNESSVATEVSCGAVVWGKGWKRSVCEVLLRSPK